ncbi:SagB/ThcOx family dehydrogenase [Pseudodesulfovibrio sp. zrk46]|uniref:SagB/ThcOx family dehydrogenase n=1 Tax=Pseudodesulfovibrio sp. zrk46 TaxID=2725288 RepID=UPI001449BEC9|nr:SagB/ThcOx family dehydrogenase [Pseudodesulfovibrio sp. zrk46]QJB56094.1 SagB/ThcOx family dehydrogenase [Pseudodesulfovibrio sp. zrk46]
MANDLSPILNYHLDTSHQRGKISGRTLNREEYPVPFKLYRSPKPFHLAHDLRLPNTSLGKSLDKHPLPKKPNMPGILAAICNLTAGISQVRRHHDGNVFHFRTVASAGALYPAEFYIALQNVSGMTDGLYHYCPLEHTLTQLRSGYVFGALSGTAPIVRFYLTSIFHRSAWKYGPRAYRYCLLDTGHMAENLLHAARIHGMPARIDYDFKDNAVNRFLAVDPDQEGCFAVIHSLGCSSQTDVDDTVPPLTGDLPLFSRAAPTAEPPEGLMTAHKATSSFARCPAPREASSSLQSTPLPAPALEGSVTTAIMKRRSSRNFIPIKANTKNLVDIISYLCHDTPPICSSALQVGFIASPNSGLTPGYHLIDRDNKSTMLMKSGDLMAASARVCLDQSWLQNAALHIVFTADLHALNNQCGPRAYRYAHLEAGRLGQRLYLAATSKNLGACGIGAFFDYEAAELLSLPFGNSLLYLVAVGPVRK